MNIHVLIWMGEIQTRGVEWLILGELWQTWLEYDTVWKERCMHISSYWCSRCHGNGPLNKGYVDYYGVTHTQHQASLIMYTIIKLIHAYQTHTHKHKYSHCAVSSVHYSTDNRHAHATNLNSQTHISSLTVLPVFKHTWVCINSHTMLNSFLPGISLSPSSCIMDWD